MWFTAIARQNSKPHVECWYANITQKYQLLFPQSHVYISQLLKTRQQCYANNISLQFIHLFILRDDSALRALSSLRGLRGAPEVPPLFRETLVSRTANVERTVRH